MISLSSSLLASIPIESSSFILEPRLYPWVKFWYYEFPKNDFKIGVRGDLDNMDTGSSEVIQRNYREEYEELGRIA